MTHLQLALDSLALARPALAAGWRDGVCCVMAAGLFLWVVGVVYGRGGWRRGSDGVTADFVVTRETDNEGRVMVLNRYKKTTNNGGVG